MSKKTIEEKLYLEIIKWEERLLSYTPNEVEVAVDKLLDTLISKLPNNFQNILFSILDELLFQTHRMLQDSELDEKFRLSTLSQAKLFENQIEDLHELSQLTINEVLFLDNNQTAKSKLYAYFQGGITGALGKELYLADIPSLIVLNLRAVQKISVTYGFDPREPYEQMISLKVFYGGLLPKRHRKIKWIELNDELLKTPSFTFIYEGNPHQLDAHIIELLLYEYIKLTVLNILRKDKNPTISALLGAYVSGKVTNDLIEYATYFYRKRWLNNK